MKRLKAILAMAVLAFWVPATNHCRLELIPGLQFLSCCSHSAEEQASDQHKNECDEDLCAQVEGSLYKAESNQVVVKSPPVATLFMLPSPSEQRASLDRVVSVRPDASPPELPRTWQFSCRAAAPPRAPSFVS